MALHDLMEAALKGLLPRAVNDGMAVGWTPSASPSTVYENYKEPSVDELKLERDVAA